MKIRIICLLVFFISSYAIAQGNLNAYKYVTVPKKFDFQKSEDQYQISSLTKFLFNKEGFKSLFDIETKPQELINNACLNLMVKISDNSNILSTKLNVELINCNNEVVYSGDGRSKFKEYKKAYHEAIRKALEPLKSLNYEFNSELIAAVPLTNEVIKEDPAIVKEEIPVEVKDSESVEVVNTVESDTAVKADEAVKSVGAVVAVEESVVKQAKEESIQKIEASNSDILYAQEKNNGYQLVDSSPKVVYVLQKSSVVDLFILKDKNGIVYKKDGKWLVEYYSNNELFQKELNIKF